MLTLPFPLRILRKCLIAETWMSGGLASLRFAPGTGATGAHGARQHPPTLLSRAVLGALSGKPGLPDRALAATPHLG